MSNAGGVRTGPDLAERVIVALRREREAGSGVLARGLGAPVGSVSAALQRLIAAGRVRVVRKQGQALIYALVVAEVRS